MPERIMIPGRSIRRAQALSRRRMLMGSAIAGVSATLGLSALKAHPAIAEMSENNLPNAPASDVPNDSANNAANNAATDAAILNTALYYEHQAIWAYGFAAAKLSNTDVGQAVLALAERNMQDHMAHRDALAAAISNLGAMPVSAESQYDVSAYIQNGEGNLDNDVNIAKLALALETDAAIAYTIEVASLKTPELITAGASIGATESAHAAAIRAAFVSLGVNIPVVPAPFINADNRSLWVLSV
jgi:rubrerythrin